MVKTGFAVLAKQSRQRIHVVSEFLTTFEGLVWRRDDTWLSGHENFSIAGRITKAPIVVG